MLKNYLKIGLRNFLKQKLFTLINISGMSISLCCFLLIALYVNDEYKFDKHIEDADRKFRLYNVHYYDDGRVLKGSMVPPMIGPQLVAEFPEVESYSRFMNFNSPVLFKAGDKKFTEGKGGYADPSILTMLSLKLLEGDFEHALREPASIAISKTLKEKYFDDKPALGQVLEIFGDNFKEFPISLLTVDHDYVQTLGIDLIAGRDFSKEFPFDEKNAFIVSETTAKMLGYAQPGHALDHELAWKRWDAPDSVKEGKVIGVVKDFHLNSVKEGISPVVLQIYPFAYTSLSLRIKPENVQETLSHLEKTWKSFNTEWPFEYRFLDANFDKLYKAEEKLAALFMFFTGFTIFVACLGLFGLVVYSTAQRYREISIRKVLGAAESALVIQLSRNYMVLIFIAFFIAMPLSYYAASQWLEKFPYRIDLGAMLFIKSGLLIIAIALLTVGLQSYKATRANPVDTLKEQ